MGSWTISYFLVLAILLRFEIWVLPSFKHCLDSNLIRSDLCFDYTLIRLWPAYPLYPYSGDMSYTPIHPQRPPWGLSPGVGNQRELHLFTRLWAVFSCCANLHRERDVERRLASVLAWVIISYVHSCPQCLHDDCNVQEVSLCLDWNKPGDISETVRNSVIPTVSLVGLFLFLPVFNHYQAYEIFDS